MAGETWIWDLMHNVSTELLAEYVMLWLLIDDLHFNPTDQRAGEIIWTRTANGQYSARSTFLMQFQGSLQSDFKRLIWHVWAPLRCKFFVWLMLQNRAWTADRLLLRQWPNEYFCPLCFRNLETMRHLQMECHFTRAVWEQISTWTQQHALQPSQWKDDNRLTNWHADLSAALPVTRAKGIKSLTILVCWWLWCEWNRRIFDDVERSVGQVVAAIQSKARQWTMVPTN
jgi:hypothetical protein